ncbi:LysR substrate-binding domain-containing protein [Saccharopolyspora shandongensis]|uniref:LysR family transcriptional regulator n=1 Tax=Saccharopolyspora shandongensis TaxID=418495 RepID=UPI003444E467
MTLQQLRYFLAVARALHFTKAAEAVKVAQSSLSNQIRALEVELGAELFVRARGSVLITPAGEALLPIATRMLADADVARREVADVVGVHGGLVRLGAPPSLCVTVLADALRAFHREHPGVRLSVRENGSRDLASALLHGQLDLALVVLPTGGVSDQPSLSITPLLTEELVVATAATGAKRPGAPIPIEALRDRQMVMFREGYDLRETTLRACAEAGFTPKLAVEGGEMDAVLCFVEAGLGAAIVPRMVLSGRPGLRGTRLARPGLRRTIGLARRTDTAPTNAVRAFETELLGFLHSAAVTGDLPSGVEFIGGRPD